MSSVARDRALVTAAGFLRAMTTSVVGITLGVHLARLGLAGWRLGIVISAGLVGAAVAAVAATFLADRVGRRRFLLVITGLGVLGAAGFALTSSPLVLAAAAFVGMLNGMGRDRGAALVIEQAALPGTTTDAQRTRVIAVYTMLQDLGHALGAILAGVPAWIAGETLTTTRGTFLACAVASLAGLGLYLALGRSIEAPAAGTAAPLSPRSRAILAKISALFALDGLGGGFLTTAMLSYFFFERFGAGATAIGALFFGARIMNALSHLGAAWLAKKIGLVKTMVLTHMPSSLLLVTVAFAPSFPVAAVLFLLREGLVEMDVPTRQSYVLAVVAPEERTRASGITNLVRLAAWAVAPLFAGALMTGGSMFLPLVIGASMKITYDLLLWRAFRGLRPPEELTERGASPSDGGTVRDTSAAPRG